MPFVTFDIIPPEYSTMHIFDFDENDEPYNGALAELKYDTCNFVLNSGSLFIFFLVLVLQYIVYVAIRCFN